MSDETKLLASLASAGEAGLTRADVSDVFDRHRTKDQLQSVLDGLIESGAIETWKQPGNGKGGPHVQRFRVSSQVAREVAMSNGNSEANALRSGVSSHSASPADAEAVDVWTPPKGEGWVEWKVIVRIAEAGVPFGTALRYGKKLRAQQHWTKEQLAAIPKEQYAMYGERRISHPYLDRAVRGGAIERRGQWCRLVRDPVTTPRMWMAAVYQILGQAHPTLTGEFTRKPAKTLASVMQEHLGRELLPEVFVRRRPGSRAGSWDPADMKLHSRLLHPSDVEENERRLIAFRARMEAAPEIQERPRFQARLPKHKRGRSS